MQDAVFEQNRPRLRALAYRMLGGHSDAEDVVQDVWLRWQRVSRDEIRDETGWLVRVCSNLCLDFLKSARVRHETYVGQWLPEPWVDDEQPKAESDLIRQDDLSQAYLLMLEHLGPVERVAFVLHDVFDWDHDEIAPVIERTPNNTRQILFRARRKMSARSPEIALPENPGDARRHIGAVAGYQAGTSHEINAFLGALRSGEIDQVMAVLAPGVILHSDSGGKASAAINRVFGSDRVARFFAGIWRKSVQGHEIRVLFSGAEYWLLVFDDGKPATAIGFAGDGENGLTDIFVHRNPDKLSLFARLLS